MRRSRRGRLSRSSYFNPRTHVGCDANILSYERFTKISIQAPTWGATFSGRAFSARSLFQSTHPRGVRPRLSADTWVVLTFQSTHPRGVRQPRGRGGKDSLAISIHAPTWGATAICRGTRSGNLFQSTHPRGVRQCVLEPCRGHSQFQSTHPRGVRRTLRRTTVTPTRYFNPRTHVGCDERRVDVPHGYAISIHAPTWGATPTDVVSSANLAFQSTHPRGVRQSCRGHFQDFRNFNPRTHVGCDDIFRCVSPDDLEFQSTHPRGVRLHDVRPPAARDYFNPRTHVGCDPLHASVGAGHRISIHAPTWGATALQDRVQQDFIDFNPRTHVGCD